MDAPATYDATERRGAAPEAGVSRLVIGVAVAGTILLALGAFWLSFTTLQDLAILSGIPAGQAWVWPLIVDGVILEATISVVALRNSARTARRFAWLLLTTGAAVSVAANVTHAVIAADARVPALIAAVVASIPPLVLLAMTHLTVELTRNATPRPAPTTPADPADPPRVYDLPRSAIAHDEATGTEADDDSGAEDAAASSVAAPDPPLAPVSTDRMDAAPVVARRSRSGREAARARALELHRKGVPLRQIAAREQVHPTTVGRWLNAPELRQDGADHD